MTPTGLRYGPIRNVVHLCIDMQRLFAEETAWKTPWMARVLPAVVRIAAAHPADTIFTRFIPAQNAGKGVGVWKRYWERWESMTLDRLAPGMTDLVPALQAFVPPALIFDKPTYSPWIDDRLERHLSQRETETLIITGGETDVCVLAAVLGAVDRGYRVIVASDALCSSSDETHDALMTLYDRRYTQQVETASAQDVLRAWRESEPPGA